MANAALILCAGKSTRMRGYVVDKVLTPLNDRPALLYSVDAFAQSGLVDSYCFVHRDEEQRQQIEHALQQGGYGNLTTLWAEGGTERQDSVFHGLSAISLVVSHVFIHDAARPLIYPELLQRLLDAAIHDKAAVAAHRVTDTIKQVRATRSKTLRRRKLRDVPRDQLWAMETPQVFDRELILEAYRVLRRDNIKVTDDTAALEALKYGATIVENERPNYKLTTPGDVALISHVLRG